jgi:adenylylsulfate kinase
VLKKEKMKNIVWHNTAVKKEDREKLLNQKGILLWFTGLSGSGKSTIANILERRLYDLKKHTYLLDGDNIRHGLNFDLGFSLEDRKENIRRISEVAKLFIDAGIITIAAFVSPLNEDRNNLRNAIKQDFIEIFVNCSLKNCEKRDPKGLYKKARSGEIKNFTGIDSPYETPINPELVINTDTQTPEESAEAILNYLNLKGFKK